MKDTPSIRQLRAFVAVYQSGKVATAAEQLALTQPAVSVLLRQLEDKLGVRLFDRTTRSMHRTEAAHEVMEVAQRVLSDLDGLGRNMRELAQVRRGRVAVAATSTIAQTLMPRAMRRFLADHPQVQVVLDDCAPQQFVPRILAEQVDLGVGTPEDPESAELDMRVLIRDHLNVVCTADHPLAARRSVSWGDLAGCRLITIKAGYGIRRSIDQAAAQAGAGLDVAHEVALLTTALALAAQGLGVSILPASLITHGHHPGLVARKLLRPVVTRDIGIVTRRGHGLSPAARAFVAALEREFAA